MTWSDTSFAGLCRATRRRGHDATALRRADEAGAIGPAAAHRDEVGAALATGSLAGFVETPGPAGVVAEHPMHASRNGTMLAAATSVRFTGALLDPGTLSVRAHM